MREGPTLAWSVLLICKSPLPSRAFGSFRRITLKPSAPTHQLDRHRYHLLHAYPDNILALLASYLSYLELALPYRWRTRCSTVISVDHARLFMPAIPSLSAPSAAMLIALFLCLGFQTSLYCISITSLQFGSCCLAIRLDRHHSFLTAQCPSF